MRSNAVVISIARGEGDGAPGAGEGGEEEHESLEWTELRPTDASEVFHRGSCSDRLTRGSWMPGMETLELRRSWDERGLII